MTSLSRAGIEPSQSHEQALSGEVFAGERTRRAWFIAALLLAAVFIIGNLALVAGKAAPIWDAQDFFAPSYTLIADHARAGRIVLWNPWQSAGSPDFAEPELGNASPVAILIGAALGGTEAGFRGYWLLIWFLGPVGMLLLARHVGAPPWGAFVVASAFAFCGFYTSHAEHTSSLYSFSCLPFIVWRFDVALRSRKIRAAAEAGAIWGLSALGGYPQFTILTGIFIFLWAVGRYFCSTTSKPSHADAAAHRFRRDPYMSLAALVVVLGVGIVVLAPAYFAILHEAGSGFSDRVGPRSRQEAVQSNAIEPAALQTFASPYLTTVKIWNYETLWPHTDISMTNVYAGGLVTCLALFAVINCPGSRWRWWLILIAVFFLVCSVGNKLPVRGWLYDYCPPTRYFRNPGLFVAYAIFSVCLLAMLGTRDLATDLNNSSSRPWKNLLAASVLGTLCAVPVYFHTISHLHDRGPLVKWANWYLFWTWLGCVVVSVLLVLIPRSRRLLPILLVVLAIGGGLLCSKVSWPVMYSTDEPRQTWNFINAHHNPELKLGSLNRELRSPTDTPELAQSTTYLGTNDNVPLRIPTLINYVVLQNRFLRGFLQDPMLRSMALGKDRIWFAADAATVVPSDMMFAAFLRRSDSLGAPVAVVHSPADMMKIRERDPSHASDSSQAGVISQLPPAQRIAATLSRYTPNHLDLIVSCPQDGWILVTDRWSWSWRARVNGEPAEVLGADFIFRAVRVKAGINRIAFSFRPPLYLVLLIISWSTAGGILVLLQITRVWTDGRNKGAIPRKAFGAAGQAPDGVRFAVE